jgi:hypothetical protein
MLSTKETTKILDDPRPRRLWAADPEISKIRWSLFLYWVRTSIVFWILILLIALIYLGSGVVRII